jgi:3-isopropylmalate dehydratase small subunit
MPEFNIAFAQTNHVLPFLHLTAIIVFIGFQSHFWLVAKFFIKDVDDEISKYERLLNMMKRLAYATYSSLIVIALTGRALSDRDYFKAADPMLSTIIATKWCLFGFLLLNLLYSTYRLYQAKKSIEKGEYIELRENLIVIIYYFIPLNIAFALLATYLGIAYRNF